MNTTSKEFNYHTEETSLADIQSSLNPASHGESGRGMAHSRIRIVIADSEAIFRVGMSKIFALESDLEVVAQAENLQQALHLASVTACDVILFEAGLSATPAESVSDLIKRAHPAARVILVTARSGEAETVDYLRRGVKGILTRAVAPELLVRCVRKVAEGETWLDNQGVNWVIEAYRSQVLHGANKNQLRLTDKEMMIISGVTQGLKNRDIAQEVGTTEQVVKNYLRKIYDKLAVSDRLELALFSMHHRLLDGFVPKAPKSSSAQKSSGQNPGTGRSSAASAGANSQPPNGGSHPNGKSD